MYYEVISKQTIGTDKIQFEMVETEERSSLVQGSSADEAKQRYQENLVSEINYAKKKLQLATENYEHFMEWKNVS